MTYQDWHRERQEFAKDMMLEFKSTVAPLLVQDGVLELEATYSGSGDDGYIDSPDIPAETSMRMIELNPPITDWQGTVTKRVTLNVWLNRFYDTLLESVQPGWEINEGSDGRIMLHATTGTVEIEHGMRIETVENHYYDF